jgi:hypothetical protein
MTGPHQPQPDRANPTPVSPTPALPKPADRRGRWVAILTGALSILIGLVYLVLITVLDARGPMQPPPPEALGLTAAPAAPAQAQGGGGGGRPGLPRAAGSLQARGAQALGLVPP